MEDCSSHSFLCRLTLLLLFLQLPSQGSTDEFLVTGPVDPLMAVLGEDTMLPCSLSPPMNAENMELRWFRSKFSEAVFIYQNQQEQKQGQMPQYRGRTSLVKDFLTQGQAAVLINKVQVSDDGLYTCFFKKGRFYEEATLELKVAGMGSAPEVIIKLLEEGGVHVACTAFGWFPKPQVRWKDLSGEKFPTFFEAHTQDADGLFRVEALLVVRGRSARNVTCSILNPVLGQEKAKDIFIPEPFFPKSSPWMPTFFVTLSMLVFVIFGTCYFLKKEHSAKVQAQQEKRSLQLSKDEDRKTIQKALKARDDLQAELERREKVHQDALKKARMDVALKKARMDVDLLKKQFKAWSVTLDPSSAHRNLALSQENRSLALKNIYVLWNDCPCSVLGCESITSGQCYWVVEVRNGERGAWSLGVCRKNVRRTNNTQESPENGFWVVKWQAEKLWVYNPSWFQISGWKFPYRVGVFLDYNNGNVSFYNLTNASHIFSFSLISFTGTVFPYFMVRSGTVSLTMCSAAGGLEGYSVPLNNSSDKESISLPGEGSILGSGGDFASPGPESLLLPKGPEAVPS